MVLIRAQQDLDLRKQIQIRAKTPEAACVGFGALSQSWPAWFSGQP